MSRSGAVEAGAQYFGGDLRAYRSDAGVRLSEVHYGSERRWAPHTHWRAFFALLIRGGYVEALGQSRQSLVYEPLDLGFHPESTRHTDQIAENGTRFFLIELDETWVRRIRECGGAPALEPRICGGRSHRLALRLYRDFRAGDSASSESESLILEILAGLLPEAKRRKPPPWLATVVDWTRTEHPRRLSLTEMARALRLHPVYLSRAFRDHVGRSVSQCLTDARVRHAARRLNDPDTSLADIALEAGFADQSHFTRVFKRETGMTPGDYRRPRHSRTSEVSSDGSLSLREPK